MSQLLAFPSVLRAPQPFHSFDYLEENVPPSFRNLCGYIAHLCVVLDDFPQIIKLITSAKFLPHWSSNRVWR